MTTKRSIQEARTLIDAGDGEFIAKSLDSFDEADQLEIVLALIAAGDGWHVAQIVNALDYGVIIAALSTGLCFAGTIYEQEERENLREAFAFDCEQFVRDSAEAAAYTAALRRLDNAMRDQSELAPGDADAAEAIARTAAAQEQVDDTAAKLRAFLNAMCFPFTEYAGEFWPDRDDVRDYGDLLAGFELRPMSDREGQGWVDTTEVWGDLRSVRWTLTGDDFVAEIYPAAGPLYIWKVTHDGHVEYGPNYNGGLGEDIETCMRAVEMGLRNQ